MAYEDVASNYESLKDHEQRIKELETYIDRVNIAQVEANTKIRELKLQVDMLNRHVQRHSK